jgi:hypothetical protein
MKVMALDPGGTTGWATFEIPADVQLKTVSWGGPVEKHFTEAGQLAQPNHHRTLWSLLVSEAPDIIVCESYQNRNNDFADDIPVEYIGVVKLYDQTHSACYVHWNTAATGKGFSDNKKLVRLKIMLTPSEKWKHANDARRHLLQYLVFQEQFPLLSYTILYELKGL